MDLDPRTPADAQATRTAHLLAQLDGALDASMLDALQGIWSVLEHAAADSPAHARAVKERLFWESMAPAGSLAAVAAPALEVDPVAELVAPEADVPAPAAGASDLPMPGDADGAEEDPEDSVELPTVAQDVSDDELDLGDDDVAPLAA
jgi:hypothetical protein